MRIGTSARWGGGVLGVKELLRSSFVLFRLGLASVFAFLFFSKLLTSSFFCGSIYLFYLLAVVV